MLRGVNDEAKDEFKRVDLERGSSLCLIVSLISVMRVSDVLWTEE